MKSVGHFILLTHKNLIGEDPWHHFTELKCRANINSLCSDDSFTQDHLCHVKAVIYFTSVQIRWYHC